MDPRHGVISGRITAWREYHEAWEYHGRTHHGMGGGVRARAMATSTSTPASRRVRQHRRIVSPVVTMSSTTHTQAPERAERRSASRCDSTRETPPSIRRARPRRPPTSTERLMRRSREIAGTTIASIPESRSLLPTARASPSICHRPLRRIDDNDDGTGTSATAGCPDSIRARPSPTTHRASLSPMARPNSPTHSSSPWSFHARIAWRASAS